MWGHNPDPPQKKYVVMKGVLGMMWTPIICFTVMVVVGLVRKYIEKQSSFVHYHKWSQWYMSVKWFY